MTNPNSRDMLETAAAEDGQTMAEYSVVLTLVLIVLGLGAIVLLSAAIAGEFDRIAAIFT